MSPLRYGQHFFLFFFFFVKILNQSSENFQKRQELLYVYTQKIRKKLGEVVLTLLHKNKKNMKQ